MKINLKLIIYLWLNTLIISSNMLTKGGRKRKLNVKTKRKLNVKTKRKLNVKTKRKKLKKHVSVKFLFLTTDQQNI